MEKTMKASELRIGNWVDRDGKLYKILSGYGLLTGAVAKYKPILLYPEILEKFGFEFEDNKSTRYGWYKRLNKDFCIVWYRAEVIGIEDNDSDVLIEVPCFHVHQLQNLYFALTEEELEFKP